MRTLKLVAATTGIFALACSCGGIGDLIKNKVAEAVAEKAAEKATGANDIQFDQNGARVKITTDQGTAEIHTDSTKVPEGFPLPVHSSCKPQHSASVQATEGSFVQVEFTCTASVDDLAAYYDKAVRKSTKGEVSRIEDSNGEGKQVTILAGSDDGSRGTVVVIGTDSNGKTTLSLTAGLTTRTR